MKKEVQMMIKKRIAIIFGGNSTEYEVSLQSASAVFENINTKKFDIVPIGIPEMATGIITQAKKKRLQIILGLRITKTCILLRYRKTVL